MCSWHGSQLSVVAAISEGFVGMKGVLFRSCSREGEESDRLIWRLGRHGAISVLSCLRELQVVKVLAGAPAGFMKSKDVALLLVDARIHHHRRADLGCCLLDRPPCSNECLVCRWSARLPTQKSAPLLPSSPQLCRRLTTSIPSCPIPSYPVQPLTAHRSDDRPGPKTNANRHRAR